ncbi:extracellular solute-binding protein [Myxosarcina sp. GI1]|uniref:extracellular solute-binding protein n=1 Tax=Myxosarcina sp. GI1 TaxID=1541065 RepID=UPI0020A20C79|nr:extracellular solute-binding protein [Myxosarcina sp. GI1]
MKILLLEDSIPLQSIGDFRKIARQKTKVEFQSQPQLRSIYTHIQDLHRSKDLNNDKSLSSEPLKNRNFTNLATLGDSWLETAIQQNSLQPLSSEELNNWSKLPQPWHKLVRRNSKGKLDANGQIWGAPYRWGSVVIAYRKDKFKQLGWSPTDWSDLWREELRDRISLLDSPRETIGLTLKKLGYSYNTEDLERVANLESELSALHQQVKLYSSDTYLQPLILGDTWLAVGWSADVLSISKRYTDIEFVIPRSGTSLWTDLWVKPRLPESSEINKALSSTIAQWIDFCWQPKTARQISLFTNGTSPILIGTKLQDLPESLRDNLLLSSAAINFDDSEFLLPLSDRSEQQYRNLWLKIRRLTST